MDVQVDIHCSHCGSAHYSLPDGLSDTGLLRCNDCGAELGSVAMLTAELLNQALDRSAEARKRRLDAVELDPGSGAA